MTLSMKTYTCSKCGRVFTRWEGGVVPPVMKELTPVCDECKKNGIKEIISKISEKL